MLLIINMSIDDLRKEKLMNCLIKLALKSGFDSFENFRTYKEATMCSLEYKAVYPEFQIITTSDDKTYVDNLKIMTAQNLYDSKTKEILKLNDKLSTRLKIFQPPINWWASENGMEFELYGMEKKLYQEDLALVNQRFIHMSQNGLYQHFHLA